MSDASSRAPDPGSKPDPVSEAHKPDDVPPVPHRKRKDEAVQRLLAACHSLDVNYQVLQRDPDMDPMEADRCREYHESFREDRRCIHEALARKRIQEAMVLFDGAWLRFAQVVPDDKLALLSSLGLEAPKKPNTSTQTLIGMFEAVREEAAQIVLRKDVDRAAWRSFILVIEQTRPKIAAALGKGAYDQAWFLLRKLWVQRLRIVPDAYLQTERRAVRALAESSPSASSRERFLKELDNAAHWTDMNQLRGLLWQVRRELSESAQYRYWRFDIYKRRVRTISRIVGLLLLPLLLAVLAVRPFIGDDASDISLLVAVALCGALGGGMSGLQAGKKGMGLEHISAAYFKESVAYLRLLCGAINAVILYFMLASNLLAMQFGSGSQELAYLALAFVAGFSERWFVNALDRAGHSALPPEPPPAKPAAAPKHAGADADAGAGAGA